MFYNLLQYLKNFIPLLYLKMTEIKDSFFIDDLVIFVHGLKLGARLLIFVLSFKYFSYLLAYVLP